jgi:L-alanine-DL-glutamate epimerase-like enolase superfamily enzyme
MEITRITSHVLQYEMPEQLGYSQYCDDMHIAHVAEAKTDDGMTGWGECVGSSIIVIANQTIATKVIQRMQESDTTDDKIRDELLQTPFDIQGQVKAQEGRVAIPTGSGIGVRLGRDFTNNYSISV